jgi:MFS transporter, PAT family, beta-lactamase induction signal transducer AmpG
MSRAVLGRGVAHVAAVNRWILSESRPLRLSTLFILYVAQGVPLGLFWFAIPAWMAANGASAADVGYVLGLTALPWTLKLVNGFIMDRYTFLAMGRRRIWIIGAQMVMIALLVSCALIGPGVTDILLLGIAGFVVNMATTFQDVAVDGMAVDIMEEEERARASGMMFGGQSIGIAAATALSGFAIARLGPSAAFLLSASFIGAITLYLLLLTERAGERLVPWSAGDVHPRNRAIHVGAWWPILKSTVVSMIRPVSLFWLPVLFVRGFHYGMFAAVTPLIGTGNVGWSEVRVTSLVGTAQLVAGILGLTLGGWLGDTFGAKKSTIAMFATLMAVSAAMWFSVAHWGDPTYFTAFVYTWYGLDVLITVVALPISMRLCDPRVAATQFTLYMATANFGISVAAWVVGFSRQLSGLPMMFVVVFALHLVGLMLVVLVKFPRRTAVEGEVAAQLAEGDGPEPVIN